MKNNVLVFGAGYVGFSISVVLARSSKVTVCDVREEVVSKINKGISPIIEDGISKYLNSALQTGNLRAALYDKSLVKNADLIVLALPTDYDANSERFDTTILENVLDQISKIDNKKSIVIKSTIPVGFTNQISERLNLVNCFYSPEFLREGKAVIDNLYPSRIIVGSKSRLAEEFVSLLIGAARKRNIKVIFTDNNTAEVIKLASNAYLANRITFFNEVDSLAMELGLNAEELVDGICSDSRIGDGYNNPSFGYGGYCLPKDVRQFQRSFRDLGIEAPLIGSIDKANQQRIQNIVSFLVSQNIDKIGIYRTQMKQGSDNAREAVSLSIIEQLLEFPKIELKIYEPQLGLPENLKQFQMDDFEEFVDWAEIVLANRDAIELEPYRAKVLTRDIYNEN